MKITLAALLHDIGKFYQRASKRLDKKYYEYVKNDGYYHACYTAQFIADILNIKFDLAYNLIKDSAGHHRDVEGIVKTADIIASGHDRRDAKKENLEMEDTEKIAEQKLKDAYKAIRMNSIFNEVKTIDGQKNKPSYVKLTSYDNYEITDSNYANELKTNTTKAIKEYNDLFNDFLSDLEKMNEQGYDSYEMLHQLIYPIIEKYTTTFPANTMSDFATVSLFEHLKLTAAIASCLEKDQLKEKPFVLLDYDISGIQAFIYQITEGNKSKQYISKSLRTRSFYLNILADFIAYYIANEFKVSYENILYSSAGRGRILLPNTDDFETKIKDICNKLEEEIYQLHHGKLAIIFNYKEVDGKELKDSNLSDFIEDKKEIGNKKQKFVNIISKPDFKFVKEATDKLCTMCNINESTSDLCEFCNKMIELNDEVIAKENEFVVEFNYHSNKMINDLKKETTSNFILKVGNLGHMLFYLNPINKVNVDSFYLSINNYKIGEVKYYARSIKSNISFQDIEKIKKNNLGDNKLAVIKMDVDNLGYIFLKGLSEKDINNKDKQTISKILTLSRNLDNFFTHKLVNICGENVYINYAGGDDLVIIVPGWQSLDLVLKINQEFKKYTTENASFHISSGIDLFDAVTPIRYAIARADENLEASKNLDGKDAFTVLDCTIKNDELESIINKINEYENAIIEEKISRGGIYDMYSAILSSLEDKDILRKYMTFIPHIAYSIKRNIADEEWKEKLLKTFVFDEVKEENLRMYKVILSYALMDTREETKNE